MKSILSFFGALACFVLSAESDEVIVGTEEVDKTPGVLNNLIHMDREVFEELIASENELKVKNDQTWLVFFDSYTCQRCPEVYDVFLDLSNVQELVSEFKLAHIQCGKAHSVCHRLGIKGFPTISVLEGSKIYDYQGRLTVDGLSKFVTSKKYLNKSKARRIRHVQSPYENLVNALTEMSLKCRAFTMLLFKFIGLGHLEEEFVI